jgi:hypothetical protein
MGLVAWFIGPERPRMSERLQFGGLFLLMLLWLGALPFLGDGETSGRVFVAVFSLITLQALHITARSGTEQWMLSAWVVIVLAAPLIDAAPVLHLVLDVLAALLLVFVPVRLSAHVLGQSEVSANTVFGALCAYLFLGMCWALIYARVAAQHAGAFAIPDDMQGSVPIFVYFSFTTLTTLGYGDVAPRMPISQMLAILEALVGQIYLVVIVARLVGAQMASAPAVTEQQEGPHRK